MDTIQGKEFKYFNTCVTIGKFDGIHIGHRKIINKVIEISNTYGLTSTVFTFDHDYFYSGAEKRLNTKEEKLKLLEECGISLLIDYPFDPETRNLSPEQFAALILADKLGTKAVVIGENFRFGKDAKGDVDSLTELGKKYGFCVYPIPLVEYDGDMVSSTRIRNELIAGHLREANEMLYSNHDVQKHAGFHVQ